MAKKISLPISDKDLRELRIGDDVLLSGVMYVARDAAHRRMVETLEQGGQLPLDISGQTIYYMGPSPAKAGQAIGAAGPTTSGRMDLYSPRLISEGLKVMIGKGMRSPAASRSPFDLSSALPSEGYGFSSFGACLLSGRFFHVLFSFYHQLYL